MDLFKGYGVEIKLNKSSDFLVVKETLTRMGVPNVNDKKLFQSCHILHKQGRYVIIHYKELYAFDGKSIEVSEEDILRRNRIVSLLAEWNLIKILHPDMIANQIPINQLKILNFKEKHEWSLEPKYRFLEKKQS